MDLIGIYKRYSSIEGRAPRKEYNYFTLALVGIFIILGFITAIISNIAGGPVGVVIGIVAVILSIVPAFATAIRRLHDHNLSGWTLLWLPFAIGFATFVIAMVEQLLFGTKFMTNILSVVFNILYILFFMAKRGTVGPNKYGSDPLEGLPV